MTPDTALSALAAETPAWHAQMAILLGQSGQLALAEARARAAIRLAPVWSETHCVLASVLSQQGRLTEAIEAYQAVVDLEPSHAMAHLLLANACLRAGAWRRGWPELEWRLAFPHCNPLDVPVAARWRGERLPGGTLLVHAPDGAGDAIQFARYIPALTEHCSRVVLAVEAPLITLLQQIPGASEVVDDAGPLPPYDRYVDRLSLPGLFGTTATNVPSPGGYLRAAPARAADWARSLPAGPKIGLVWASHPAHPGHQEKSIPVQWLQPIVRIPGATFVNLQVGQFNADGEAIGLTLNAAAQCLDYADTAALLINLDLVISVDTSVCHLAGALGIRTWTLLPHPSEWRWMVGSEMTPWYNSMRLFRQEPEESTWSGVVDRVARALTLLLQSPEFGARNGLIPFDGVDIAR